MSNKVKPIPEGYHTLTPYLVVKGADKAIEFYKKALGAKELFRIEMAKGVIGHAEMEIGDSRFMLSEECPDHDAVSPLTLKGTALSLLVYVEDVDAFFNKAIKEGMKVKKPIVDEFWGDRMGACIDPFGHVWSIATHKEDVSPEEMKKRMEACKK